MNIPSHDGVNINTKEHQYEFKVEFKVKSILTTASHQFRDVDDFSIIIVIMTIADTVKHHGLVVNVVEEERNRSLNPRMLLET